MVEESGGWNDAERRAAGRASGFPDESRAWVIARWDATQNYWRIADVPNDRGYQSPSTMMIKSWRDLPSTPKGTKIVKG
jgi:hypothetical protein